MSRFRRVTAAVLVVSMSFAPLGVSAQSVHPPMAPAAGAMEPPAFRPAEGQSPQSTDTMAAGMMEGELLAEGQRTGGKVGVGVAVGLLTGLIGTGIGYFVIGPESLSAEAMQRSTGKSADFQLGLKTGWEKKTKSKKRNAFLAGGLLGTAAWIALLASARGSDY